MGVGRLCRANQRGPALPLHGGRRDRRAARLDRHGAGGRPPGLPLDRRRVVAGGLPLARDRLAGGWTPCRARRRVRRARARRDRPRAHRARRAGGADPAALLPRAHRRRRRRRLFWRQALRSPQARADRESQQDLGRFRGGHVVLGGRRRGRGRDLRPAAPAVARRVPARRGRLGRRRPDREQVQARRRPQGQRLAAAGPRRRARPHRQSRRGRAGVPARTAVARGGRLCSAAPAASAGARSM